jgi:hypothetical protein
MSKPPGEQRPSVFYVMGAGRSGSTTLGIALGNCEGVFFAGELDNWLVRSGRPQVEDAERLRFWDGVRARLEDPAAAETLFGNRAQRAIERSLSLLRVNQWVARRRLAPRYRAVAADLYRAVSQAAGKQAIADTSHYPLRAAQLQRVGQIDLFLVFLVRDPQGVVASFDRHDVGEFTKSKLHTNVYLWVTQVLSALVFLRAPRERRLLVRYEQFLADPGATLAAILAMAGIALESTPDFTALQVGVPLQGNRVTRSQTLSLKPGTDTLARASLSTKLLQGPLIKALSLLRPSVAVRGD